MNVNKILKYIIWIGIFFIPLVPILRWDHLFFPFITGRNFAFRIIVEIIFASWLILALRDQTYRPKKSFILYALLAFVGIIALADMFGVDPGRSIWSNFERMEGLVAHIHFLLFFLVLSGVAYSEKFWDWFFHTHIAVSIGILLYSVLQFKHELVINQGGVRVDGTLGNAAYLAVYLLFIIFLLIYFLCLERVRVKHILYSCIGGFGGFFLYYLFRISSENINAGTPGKTILLISVPLLALFIYLLNIDRKKSLPNIAKVILYGLVILGESYVLFKTGTRGAILGLAFGVTLASLLIAIFEKQNKKLRKISIGIILFILVSTASFVSLKNAPFVKSNPTLARFSSLLNTTPKAFFLKGEGKSRYLNGTAALKGFKDRPILGWGQDNFNYIFTKYFDPKMYDQEPGFDRVHNIIFDWLIAGGIFGLLAYLTVFFSPLFLMWRRKENPLLFYEKAILSGLFLGYFVENLTVFDNVTSYILFFSVLAYLQFKYGGQRILKDKIVAVDLINTLLAPAIVVILLFSLYYVNIRGVLASKTLIDALSIKADTLNQNLADFKKASDYHYGRNEVRQFLAQVSDQVTAAPNIDPQIKNAFFSFAKSELDKQIADTPSDPTPYYLSGLFYSGSGMHDEAISYLEKAVALSPKKQNMLLQLGVAYINAKNYQKAQEIFKRTYELEPHFDDAKIFYAVSAMYLKNDALAKSLLGAEFEELASSDQRFMLAYAATGRFEEVISIWKKRIESEPGNLSYRISLAATYIKIGKRAAAVLELQKAVKDFPEFKNQGEELIKEIQSGKQFDL